MRCFMHMSAPLKESFYAEQELLVKAQNFAERYTVSMVLFHLVPKNTQAVCLQAKEGALPLTPKLLPKKWQALIPFWEASQECYAIPLQKAIDHLKTLAAESALVFQEKPLVCNFFANLSLHVEALISDGVGLVLPTVVLGEKQLALSEVDYLAIGNPPFLIYKQTLRTFNAEIDTRLFRWIVQNQECEADALRKVAQDLQEESEYGIAFSLKEEKETVCFSQVQIVLQDHFGQYLRVSQEKPELEKDLEEVGYKRQADGSFRLQGIDPTDALEVLINLGFAVRFSSGEEVCVAKNYSLEVKEVEGKVQFEGSIFCEGQSASSVDALLFASKNRLFFPLPGKKVCLVPRQLQQIGKALCSTSFSIEKGKIQLLARHALALPLEQVTMERDVSALFQQEWFKEPYPPATSFQGVLRSYQQEGVNWLGFLDKWRLGAILADEMGLGKTVQWIAYISTILKEGKHLLLVPKSLGNNWMREIVRFLPLAKVQWMQRPEEIDSETDIVIASYSLCRKNSTLFASLPFRSITLDEAQLCKNSDTKIYQTLWQIKAEQRVALTGTPIENHLGELINLLQFVFRDFSKEKLSENPDYLKSLVRPFLLRRTKNQVAKELPEKVEKTVFLEMGEKQNTLYQKWEKEGLRLLQEGKQTQAGVFELLLRLRQIALSPLLVERFLAEEDGRGSTKIAYLQRELPLLFAEGKKVLLFSQFASFLHLVRKECTFSVVPTYLIDGATEERQQIVDAFQEKKGAAFLLMSLKAGGVGLNVTAADVVILSDPWWNEAAENQAIDRAHRIGRTSSVLVLRLIAAETVEEKMMELKQRKTELAGTFLRDTSSLETETKEMLLELFCGKDQKKN